MCGFLISHTYANLTSIFMVPKLDSEQSVDAKSQRGSKGIATSCNVGVFSTEISNSDRSIYIGIYLSVNPTDQLYTTSRNLCRPFCKTLRCAV